MAISMDLDEALCLLDLQADDTTTAKDVEQAFRQQARRVHPDAGGSRADWDALEEAQQVALRHFAEVGTELEVLTLRELVLANQSALNLARRREETADTMHAVVRRRTSPLIRARRLSWGFTTASAIALALYKLLEAFPAEGQGPEAAPKLFDTQTIFFTLIISAIGLAGLFFKIRADRITQAVEDLTAELGDHEVFSRLRSEIDRNTQPGGNNGSGWWDGKQLEAKVSRWIDGRPSNRPGPAPFARVWLESLFHLLDPPPLAAIARKIGGTDAARIILRKGLEIGAIESHRDSPDLYAWKGEIRRPRPAP